MSSLRVIEATRILSAIFPERIQIGFILSTGKGSIYDNAQEKTLEIFCLSPDNVKYNDFKIVPETGTPPFFLCGNSIEKAKIAASLGWGFMCGHKPGKELVEAIKIYRNEFVPNIGFKEPYVRYSNEVIIGKTTEEAELLGTSKQILHINYNKGIFTNPISPPNKNVEVMKWNLMNNPKIVAETIKNMMERFFIDEFIICPIYYDFEKRCDSLRLLAEEIKL
jgi:alkanesulfonate monooxygenase SsuD/methylene tetrahydromethanopterin reductase-like flavin-dependent oxidoreductase (luciferase family)